ncbi:MAG: hypothetical protein ACOYOA_11485 [Saprospiraceae bacterium]
MIVNKLLVPLLLTFLARSYGQEITYQLSQDDVNFIYSEAIKKIAIDESQYFENCCLKDYLRKFDSIKIKVNDSLFTVEKRLISTEDVLPLFLKPNIANIDSLYQNVTFSIQKPFYIVKNKFTPKFDQSSNIYLKIKFSNIARIDERLYFNVLYSYRDPNNVDEREAVFLFSFELKICENNLIYFSRILLGFGGHSGTYQNVKINSEFCR